VDKVNGVIAFVSDRSGDRDIYTMGYGGFGQKDITNVPLADEFDPA
jgi:hypothetical protein